MTVKGLLPGGSARDSRWREVAGALARFFAGGSGPSHSAINTAFDLAGVEGGEGNKEERVRWAIRNAPDENAARRTVEELLDVLRNAARSSTPKTLP